MARSSEYQPDVMPPRYPDGWVYIDGARQDETTNIEVGIEFDTAESKVLSQRGTTVYETGDTISGKFTVILASPFWQQMAYRKHKGDTVRFDIIAQCDDENSQYYKRYGAKQDLFKDCVLTGNVPITKLDANESGPVTCELNFTAREWVPNYV